jgi:uncharacterized membrane protein
MTSSFTPKSLLVLMLLSWALLIGDLSRRSLWVDEFLTHEMIQGSWRTVLTNTSNDIHPPLYFLALHGWTQLAGDSDFALRWFSIAAGFCAVALMYVMIRRALNTSAALFATLLLGSAPAFIEFSRMARYYSLLLALGLVSTMALQKALQHDARKYWLVYGAAGLMLVYTFYPSAILLVAQGVCFVMPTRQRALLKRWVTVGVIIALSFSPWFALTTLRQVGNVYANTGVDLARSLLGFGLGIVAGFYTLGIGETLFPWNPLAFVGAGCIVTLILANIMPFRATQNQRPASPHAWAYAGLFLISIVSLSFTTTYLAPGTPFLNVPVRGLFTLPFYLALWVSGWQRLPKRAWAFGLGSLLLVVWSYSLYNYYQGQQFLNPIYLTPAKEAARYVGERLEPNDVVLSDYDSVFGYYFSPTHATTLHRHTGDPEIESILQTRKPKRVWLVTIGRDQSQRLVSGEPTRALLASTYRLSYTQKFLPIDAQYLIIKNFLLNRNSYEFRLQIELYELRPW